MFDLIIATYNRPNQTFNLVKQILECNSPRPNSIIIVDSSQENNWQLFAIENLIYIHSSHKNQPYQRALGCSIAKSDIVIFLDDDLFILNTKLFSRILDLYNEKDVVGVGLGLKMHEIHESDAEKIGLNRKNIVLDMIWRFTGAQKIKEGKIGLAGLVGEKNSNTVYVESLSGGVMSFKKVIFERLYDSRLFDYNEMRLGKGEDKYLSMGAMKYGKLKFDSNHFLSHPSVDSFYKSDVVTNSRREIFSRLLLSYRLAEIKGISSLYILIHYYWFAFWRLVIGLFHFFIHPKRETWKIFVGRLYGVFDTLKFNLKDKNGFLKIDWELEMAKDKEKLWPIT